jgi:signal transduction histidine kinase
VESDRRRLRTFIAFELVTTATAVVAILLVWLLVHPSVWLLVLAGMVAVFGLLIVVAVIPLRNGRLEHAIRWLAVANWLTALGTTSIATFAWPVLALAALLPAVFSIPYASGAALRLYAFVSVGASVGVALLGVLQDFSRLSEQLPEWIRQVVVIGFTPFLAAMIAQLGLENSGHLNRLLRDANAANEGLRRSEEVLAAQAEELRLSRARLVAATDRERRRIERDLHDGAQQRLVALSVRLSMARETIRHDPAATPEVFDDLRAEVKAAQVELNRLAQGIYPPALTEHGLAAALQSAVDRAPNPVETDVSDVGRHPPDIEAAVYFCCVEALQNAAKHAGHEAVVHVALRRVGDREIEFQVSDDGAGFNPATATRGNGFVKHARPTRGVRRFGAGRLGPRIRHAGDRSAARPARVDDVLNNVVGASNRAPYHHLDRTSA